MYTSNRLLLRGYPGAVGVKTGYTTLARNTLIAAAERDGRTIVVTLLGEPPGATYRDAEALLDWGFANAAANPVGVLVEPSPPQRLPPRTDPSPRLRSPVQSGVEGVAAVVRTCSPTPQAFQGRRHVQLRVVQPVRDATLTQYGIFLCPADTPPSYCYACCS